MRVPFADLARATSALRPELDAAAARVLDRGWFVLGEEGAEFERAFAAFCGVRHAVGVASGTDAIELALRALGIGPGDEVLTQANTCVPTVAAIERTGAEAVLCDADPDSGAIDPASVRRTAGERTRAVVCVHLYGQPGDVDAVAEAGGGLPVVEDCAQAHGAELRGRRAGSMGALGAFSFYPTKNLGALGDGGAVTTSDDDLAERLRRLRTYGQVDRYRHAERGVNSRLDEVQAAWLRVKLAHVEAWNQRRAEIAAAHDEALAGTPVRPLAVLPDRSHARHLYVVRAPDRDAFQQRLAADGVGTLVHYPVPIHGHPPYRGLRRDPAGLPASEALASEVVSLPLYPELTDGEAEHVAASARAAAEALAERAAG